MSAIESSSYPPYGSMMEVYPQNPIESPSKSSAQGKKSSKVRFSNYKFDSKSTSSKLIDDATMYFARIQHPNPVTCDLKQIDFPLILEEIFKANAFKGLCIGEKENHISSKKLLIENFERLRSLGVTTLFLEHIQSDLHQQELDDWFENRIIVPVETTEFLKRLDEDFKLSYPYSFTDLVYQAHKAGLRIVALDSSASSIAGNHLGITQSYELSAKQKIKAKNFTAINMIEKEKGEGNYIVFTGADHGSTTQTYEEIPGISELMKCPFLIISDSSKHKTPGTRLKPEAPYDFAYRNKPNTVHAIIVVDKSIPSPRRYTL